MCDHISACLSRSNQMTTDMDARTTESFNLGDIAAIGDAMGKMRIMIGRRFISRMAVARVGDGLELSHLDVLSLIRRENRDREITIGVIAEKMRIDHSRASRIVTEMVRNGALRREASQEDARRTIVALTDHGAKLLAELQVVKYDILKAVLDGWSEDDIAAFAKLYGRFVTGYENQANAFDTEENVKG